jgi:hypothetical protein
MIVTILKITKRNAEVPTLVRTPELSEIVAKCKNEGKLLAESASRSEDLLVTTYQAIWSSKEDYLEYIRNPIMMDFTENRAHNNLIHGSDSEFQILNYED